MADIVKTETGESNDLVFDDAGREVIKHFEDLIRNKRKKNSKRKTRKKDVKRRGDGFNYVEAGTMVNALSDAFPIWSWLPAGEQPVLQVANWIIVMGKLEVIDEGVKRSFFSPGAAQIQIKKNGDFQNWKDILSVSNTVKAANTDGLKKAINELTGLFGDVYNNKVEEQINESQKSILLEMLDKAEQINNAYNINAIEKKFGDIDNLTTDQFEKITTILKPIIGE